MIMSKTINTYKEMFWKDRPYWSFPWIAEKEFITSFIQNIQQNFWQNAHILEIWSFYGDDTKVFAEKGLNILATDAVKELLNHIENNIINNNIKTAYFDAKNPEGLYKLISDNNISTTLVLDADGPNPLLDNNIINLHTSTSRTSDILNQNKMEIDNSENIFFKRPLGQNEIEEPIPPVRLKCQKKN